jgi:rare lipoprotein A
VFRCVKPCFRLPALTAAGLAGVLVFTPLPGGAQPTDDPDAGFEERFGLSGRIAPTFTRPEVIELLSALRPSAPSAEAAAPTMPADESYRSGALAIAEPKGPAKVLKDLLTTPIKELLVSRAEAGPEVPPPQDAAPAATASVPVRAADPLAERPRADKVATVPAPMPPAASEAAQPPPGAQAGPPAEPASRPEAAPARSLAPTLNRERVAETAPQSRANPERMEARAAAASGRRIGAGRAAWYQHPGRTASGEIFDPNRLTAAHHTLPFGTRLRVVNEATDRSVVVRINDRIPRSTVKFAIDLSRASARAIGLDDVGRVSLYRLGDPAATAGIHPAPRPPAERTIKSAAKPAKAKAAATARTRAVPRVAALQRL